MRRLRLGIVAIMIGALVALVAGCGGSDPNEAKTPSGAATITNGQPDVKETDPNAVADATNGEKFFAATCQGCHASGGTVAGAGPVLAGKGLTAEAIAKQIQNPKGAMPPNLASGTDLADVVAFVVGLQAGKASGGGGTATSEGPPTTTTAAGGGGGDAASIAAGKTFFTTTCEACHTSGGTVAGAGPVLAKQGLTAAAIQKQIQTPANAMPPNLASGADLQNVTNFVLSLQ